MVSMVSVPGLSEVPASGARLNERAVPCFCHAPSTERKSE